MDKVKSLKELREIRQRVQERAKLRQTGEDPSRKVIAVGMATCGIAAGARAVGRAILDEVRASGAEGVSVINTGCLGFCYAEPMVEVRIAGEEAVRYQKVTEDIGREIVREHIIKGNIVSRALFGKETVESE